jgi:uncharacterized phage-like protein YoqJ
MQMRIEKTVCFFGHRNITITDDLTCRLHKEIDPLIRIEGMTMFLFGSKSQFDDLCHDVVSKLKTTYPHIQRVYARAEFPYIDDAYQAYLLKRYENTYFPERVMNAGKAAYIERNYEMVDKSSVCIVYYDERYLPSQRKQTQPVLIDYQPASGTGLAYKYAKKKKEES